MRFDRAGGQEFVSGVAAVLGPSAACSKSACSGPHCHTCTHPFLKKYIVQVRVATNEPMARSSCTDLYLSDMAATVPRMILRTRAGRFGASKARRRLTSSYSTHPSAQMSLFWLYGRPTTQTNSSLLHIPSSRRTTNQKKKTNGADATHANEKIPSQSSGEM